MTKHKIQVINATVLKPGAKYIIAVDKRAVPVADLIDLAHHLKSIGVTNAVALMVDGDPNKAVKIIEQE